MDTLPKELKGRVDAVIAGDVETKKVFEDLITHLIKINESGPDPKRKQQQPSVTTVESLQGTNIMLQLPELSVHSPFRKKMNLVFGAFPNEKRAYLALTKSMDDKPELVLRDLTTENIKFAAIMNVPEKPAFRQLLISYKSNDGDVFKKDPILIQLPYDQLTEQFGPILGDKTLVQYLISQLALVNFNVSDCTNNIDSFFCQAYRGSKEGYLFFLENNLIFGFKKPILIFESKNIETITYTSITRLTFNLVLHIRNSNGEVETHEFSMIDQKDYEPIDIYKRNQQFNDKSMTEELKAQKQLKNNNETPGDLAEAAKLIPGGDQIIKGGDDEDDDSEDDLNYKVGDSDDDHSDASQDDERDNTDDSDSDSDSEDEDVRPESTTPGVPTMESIGSNFTAFDEDLQQELQDLQRDLDFDINALQSAGYMNM